MPEKTKTLIQEGYNQSALLALSMSAFEKLGWEVRYAGENILAAYTPRSWNKWDMEIIAEAGAGRLTITSKMIHGESFDALGRNQKNIDQFEQALEQVKPALTETVVTQWMEKIQLLQQQTLQVAEEEARQSAEADKVLNLSKGTMYLTYGIIGINVLVFILMAIDGVDLFAPNGTGHIKWGSNYTPLTYSGDWWRLFTSNYLHFGIIHLVLNMYALYNLGQFLEPMMGKLRYLTAYVCSGVLASLASLIWHTEGVNSAGASGAIFGLIGLMMAFIVTKYIPSSIRQSLLQSVGVMAVYSLIYGMKGGIDNAAHIGGLIAGFIIGLLYWLTLRKSGKVFSPLLITGVILGLTAFAAWFLLQQKQVSPEERNKIKAALREEGFKDYEAYIARYNEFVAWQDTAMLLIKNDTASAAYFSDQKTNVALPAWDKAEALLTEMSRMKVSAADQRKVILLVQYVKFRRQELDAREELLKNPGPPVLEKVNRIADSINHTMELINALPSPD